VGGSIGFCRPSRPSISETGRTGTPIIIAGDIDAIDAGAGGVWLLDSGAGTVTRIDPQDHSVGGSSRHR
jgi:hypothetical protein